MHQILLLALGAVAAAESGIDGWLRYARIDNAAHYHDALPSTVVLLKPSIDGPLSSAGSELKKGFESIFDKTLHSGSDCNAKAAVVVGTRSEYTKSCNQSSATDIPTLTEDGYYLSISIKDGVRIVGQNERGALYGTFQYLSMLAQGNFSEVSYATGPSAPVRWVNEWDNMDGSIERGYAGKSIFFADGRIKCDLRRVGQYARLLASIGINGMIINNVNANATLVNDANIDGIRRIAKKCRPWGVRVGIAINFAAPQSVGGLSTYDPLDEDVIEWWNTTTNKIYRKVPDFAGYLIKANSEGQPGPLTYNRTFSQGANLFARAVKPHGGIVMFRGFVYEQLNYTDWKADRARAAVDFFHHLDGEFDENVIVQSKFGPVDFQVREPAAPLFSTLKNTNLAIELQITQEYLGQQAHLVYLAPLWKYILDWDLRLGGQVSPVSDVVTGKTYKRRLSGFAAVTNVGMDANWLGSHLAMSNLFAYGRLAWNPHSDAVNILHDWIRLTFSSDPAVIDTITTLSMESWPAYENYTGNLGMQTLTEVTGGHFGPKPSTHDNNGWGMWTRADSAGIGMDRTVNNGTGFAGQYEPELAAKFESLESTPDELLLWFHHVPWTYKLHSGKTVIQHIYDAHYAGAETAQTFPRRWEALKGKMDEQRYKEQLFRLEFQAGHAIVWRDAICMYFFRMNGIEDTAGRVNYHPWRVEAETASLSGYNVTTTDQLEAMSAGKAAVASSSGNGTVTATLNFETGIYDVAVGYFDLGGNSNPSTNAFDGGISTWTAYLDDKLLGTWKGDQEYLLGYTQSWKMDGNTATRITFRGVHVEKGTTMRIEGTPDRMERAPVDYIAVLPTGVVD
jgi:alpha-glucuronidase